MSRTCRPTVPPRRARSVMTRAARSFLLVLAIAACTDDVGGDGASGADGAVPLPLAESAATPRAAADPVAVDPAGECPMAGLWRRCSVVKRLEGTGFAPELVAEGVRQPGLAIQGAAYRLGSAELQLFLFADSAAAAGQADAVRPDDARPAEASGIRRPPLVVRSHNLVALLFDNNDRLRERVQLALAAGLPRD